MKRLYRSRDDRMFAGVAGGLGSYLGVDPTLLRLAFAALTLVSAGIGLLAYLALAIIVPLEPVRGVERGAAAPGVARHVSPEEEARREAQEARVPEF